MACQAVKGILWHCGTPLAYPSSADAGYILMVADRDARNWKLTFCNLRIRNAFKNKKFSKSPSAPAF
eukprot:scaffold9965_cov26-Tisochrysis_lutea.AAC.3